MDCLPCLSWKSPFQVDEKSVSGLSENARGGLFSLPVKESRFQGFTEMPVMDFVPCLSRKSVFQGFPASPRAGAPEAEKHMCVF